MKRILNLTTLVDTVNRKQWEFAQKAAILLLILIGILVLNQFLIVTGRALEKLFLPGSPNTRIWVGVYQQLCQAGAGILLYRLFFKGSLADLGICAKNRSASLRWFGIFAGLWLLAILLYIGATRFLLPDFWESMKAASLPPTGTMAMTLIFQSIFPGLGEEILFRGLIVSLLAARVFPCHEQDKAQKASILALSGIFFAVAHIYFSLNPFQITHFDLQQVITALACGAFYAAAYLKTKSLLAPFLAHNFANTTATISGYWIADL